MKPTTTSHALVAAVFTLLAWVANPVTTQAQLPDYLPTEGLVGWWPFNGNANDESGNGNDGVVNGATLSDDRDGNPNAAYSFDGVDNHIVVPFNNSLNASSISISGWLKASQLGGVRSMVARWNQTNDPCVNYVTSIDNSSNNFVGACSVYDNTVLYSEPSIVIGQWYHFLFTHNQFTGGNVYLNGILVGSIGLTGAICNSNNDLYFGAQINVTSLWRFFSGKIDDIAIYNRALTPEEITALYTGQPVVTPCADPTACNFGQEGECVFAEPNLDCAGNCLNDCNNNGVCDENEVLGCKYPMACNYNPEATSDDDSCIFPEPNYDCSGNCLLDLNNNGLCDLEEVSGCTFTEAANYTPGATLDDGSCFVTCKGDVNNDGQITSADLLNFLSSYGSYCSGAGCMDPAGCNYDPNATFDLGYCDYPAEFLDCNGACLNDADGDGVCDELEFLGCTDAAACNYSEEATEDNGSCQYQQDYFNCDGTPVNDTDGDGVPDELEVAGCTDANACNFNPAATDDDGTCVFAAEFFDCNGMPLNDTDGDGVPDELEVAGCTDANACNFNPAATDNDGTCVFAAEFFDCNGMPLNDTDGDGVPDELEVAGCTDANACNFNPAATDDNESCDYVSCISIGSPLGGGILGYLFQPGDPGYDPAVPHGIIVSNTDLGIATWGCVNTLIGATSMTLGQAANNTTLITAGCSESNIAARLCENYSSGGFSDWYLPTYWDLVKLYQNLHSQGLGGFQANYYWTSTELNAYSANLINFQNGQGIDFAKSFVSGRVRAIRYF